MDATAHTIHIALVLKLFLLKEEWFCKPCSGGVPPPVTRPEKKLSANELLPQSLFPTKKENMEGEELDSPDEMQKKEPLATQRKQEEAASNALSGIAQLRKSSDQVPTNAANTGQVDHPDKTNSDDFIFSDNISTPTGMSMWLSAMACLGPGRTDSKTPRTSSALQEWSAHHALIARELNILSDKLPVQMEAMIQHSENISSALSRMRGQLSRPQEYADTRDRPAAKKRQEGESLSMAQTHF
ncbi:hypothetical protein EG329_007033 [Mollisiaceae sp. DMI_Dod_QoI]|nr:hypothetical protein EG329_007033 [Helotiales sp. DMI_Dod_QoI]